MSAFTTNFFTFWQMNEDGTGEETLNHVGQHELAFDFLTPSFKDAPSLSNRTLPANHANRLLRLRLLSRGPGGLYRAGAALTAGIDASVSWWTPAGARSVNGPLWELDAVEVRPRAAGKPVRVAGHRTGGAGTCGAAEEQVSAPALRAWLVRRDLALIVTRDQISRDRANLQQPFNSQFLAASKRHRRPCRAAKSTISRTSRFSRATRCAPIPAVRAAA